MRRALDSFYSSLEVANGVGSLHDFLRNSIGNSMNFDVLLRSQLVDYVSAFDKLIHDLVRKGMIQIYAGERMATAKYLSESISLDVHERLLTSSFQQPKEVIFEQALYQKFKTFSFQDPDKVADGLSYIWCAKDKWNTIRNQMKFSGNPRTTLKSIICRRNAIVHEADIRPLENIKNPIFKDDCESAKDFLKSCGSAIVELVERPTLNGH